MAFMAWSATSLNSRERVMPSSNNSLISAAMRPPGLSPSTRRRDTGVPRRGTPVSPSTRRRRGRAAYLNAETAETAEKRLVLCGSAFSPGSERVQPRPRERPARDGEVVVAVGRPGERHLPAGPGLAADRERPAVEVEAAPAVDGGVGPVADGPGGVEVAGVARERDRVGAGGPAAAAGVEGGRHGPGRRHRDRAGPGSGAGAAPAGEGRAAGGRGGQGHGGPAGEAGAAGAAAVDARG